MNDCGLFASPCSRPTAETGEWQIHEECSMIRFVIDYQMHKAAFRKPLNFIYL
jgi:hypothetical protein